MTRPHILLLEDHSVVAFTLEAALHAQGMHIVVPPPGSVESTLAASRAAAPDVILLDLDLGGAIGDARRILPDLLEITKRIILFTGSMDWIRIGACVEMGAIDFVIKSEPFATLMAAISEAVAGGTRLRQAQRQRLLDELHRHERTEQEKRAPLDRLTARERCVLAALMEGKQAEAIAADSGVSEATVRSQIRGILTKLGVASQLAAVAAAHRIGWHEDSVA